MHHTAHTPAERNTYFIDIGIIKDLSTNQKCKVGQRLSDQFDDKSSDDNDNDTGSDNEGFLSVAAAAMEVSQSQVIAILGYVMFLFEVVFITVTYYFNEDRHLPSSTITHANTNNKLVCTTTQDHSDILEYLLQDQPH